MRVLLEKAFTLRAFEITGPGWLDTNYYDVVATMPPETSKDQFAVMLQVLLIERFRLKVRRAMKDVDAYNLIVGSRGLKLQEGSLSQRDYTRPGLYTIRGTASPVRSFSVVAPRGEGGLRATAWGISMEAFGSMLESVAGNLPIFDKTGLAGTYDVMLDFASPVLTTQNDAPFPTVFDALQSELGLKLELKKVPASILDIYQAEAVPSDN